MLDTPQPAMKDASRTGRGPWYRRLLDLAKQQSLATRRGALIIALGIASAGGVAAGAWSLFMRPVEVQVAGVEREAAVQVFGLGTVEARVTSKIGFKVSGILADLPCGCGRPRREGHRPGSPRRPRAERACRPNESHEGTSRGQL